MSGCSLLIDWWMHIRQLCPGRERCGCDQPVARARPGARASASDLEACAAQATAQADVRHADSTGSAVAPGRLQLSSIKQYETTRRIPTADGIGSTAGASRAVTYGPQPHASGARIAAHAVPATPAMPAARATAQPGGRDIAGGARGGCRHSASTPSRRARCRASPLRWLARGAHPALSRASNRTLAGSIRRCARDGAPRAAPSGTAGRARGRASRPGALAPAPQRLPSERSAQRPRP